MAFPHTHVPLMNWRAHVTGVAAGLTSAADLRTQLVERLIARSWIRTPAVEAAFRTVSREAFVPAGTSLGDAYRDSTVITKRQPGGGKAVSSVSAPWFSLSTPVVLRGGRHRLDTPLACSL
jgi:protein-L-isoaspartate(D-aspartate) O-methyltransferase